MTTEAVTSHLFENQQIEKTKETVMSFEMMKKAMIGAIGIVALAGAGAAQAVTITPGPGPYTFSGSSQLQGLGTSASCILSLTGTVVHDAGAGTSTVEVTSGSVTAGDLTCGFIELKNFPWVAVAPDSSVPTGSDATLGLNFDNVEVSVLGIPCSSGPVTVPAVFKYVNPTSAPSAVAAEIDFAGAIGGCSVNGALSDNSSTLEITNP